MVIRGPGVLQVLSTVWVVLRGPVRLLGSQQMWLLHWGNAGERLVRWACLSPKNDEIWTAESLMNPGGFCSLQRRYTLVEREEVHSIYPPPEWGNWHSKNGPVYSWWKQKRLCFLKEEFGENWQKFKPLLSSTCEFMARNLSFTSICCCCCCSVPQVSASLRPHGLHTPGSPVLHYPLEFVQIQVHCISDVI